MLNCCRYEADALPNSLGATSAVFNDAFVPLSVFRGRSVPRRLHFSGDASVRGKREPLVYIYDRASVGIAGTLQGLQELGDTGRAR